MPLPGITGKAGELVVVMDEQKWQGAVGDTVFSALTAPVYGLPQAEPMFTTIHIAPSAFSSIFQTHRNILLAHIDAQYEAKTEIKADVWASPQAVVEIWAPDDDSFIEQFNTYRERIVEFVLNKEYERIQKSYRAQLNPDAVAAVKEKWGLDMPIPMGYHIVRDTSDFTWIRYQTKDVTQSILIYTEPYTSDSTFTMNGMVMVMDRYAKRYVPGPDVGTYMETFTDYPPMLTPAAIDGKYAARLVGLWRVDRALMGGPFVCYAFLNSTSDRVYYLHGFVFAPGKDKRNHVRQVEAIIRGTRLIE